MADDSSDFSDIAGKAGSGAATGMAFGPYGAAIGGAVGLGLGIFGAYQKHHGASQQTSIQTGMIQTQMQEDALRRQMMEMSGRRQSLENARVVQQKMALSLQNATNQGAQFGSGYAGGKAQVQDEGNWNQLGIDMNLMAGRQMFDLKSLLAQQQIAYAQAGGTINTGAGMQALGSGILQSLPALRNLSGGVDFGSAPSSPGKGGYSSSG